jgi:hypothetical protein
MGKPFIHVRAAFIWILIQISQVIQIIQLLWTILHGVFFLDDLLRHGNGRRCWGCDGIPFIVIILIHVIVILYHAVEFILFSRLQDQLVMGLDHSFQSGPLLPRSLSIFPQPLAHGLHLCDLLA